MSTKHWKGGTVPQAGDDLLDAWTVHDDAAGLIIGASSIAAARTLLEQAITDGATISTGNLATVLIGGSGEPRRSYTADGTRAGGVLQLLKDDEVEVVENTYGGGTITRAAGNQNAIITSTLPTRPYPRVVVAFSMVNAAVSGTIGLKTLILNRDGQTARWETGAAAQSQVSMNMGVIPAGTDPQIITALTFGGTGNSTATVSSSADANRLTVIAFPTSA
jgi:hypothetical protein